MAPVVGESDSASSSGFPMKVSLLLLAIVLILPAFLIFFDSPISNAYYVMALVWTVAIYPDRILFAGELFGAFALLPFIFLKYQLVYTFYRYCMGLSARWRVLLLAVISEVQLPLTMVILELLPGLHNPVTYVPLPFVLITVLLLLRIIRPLQPESAMPEADVQTAKY